MLIRSAGFTCGWSLPRSPVPQNGQRGHQKQKTKRMKEPPHMLQPIARSTICVRISMMTSQPSHVYHKGDGGWKGV